MKDKTMNDFDIDLPTAILLGMLIGFSAIFVPFAGVLGYFAWIDEQPPQPTWMLSKEWRK